MTPITIFRPSKSMENSFFLRLYQVKSLFRIAWEDKADPEKGFKYIYLNPDDYARLAPLNSVKASLIEDEGESRYKITDIIGQQDGLGVENLKYAGLIAGETSKAYDEVEYFSISIALVNSQIFTHRTKL